MPTFCDIAGVENYVERYTNPRLANDWFDGLSFAPTLLGEGEQTQHEFLYWEFHETDMMALRMGDWKMVVQNGCCRLYNLASDLHEDIDLALQYPEVVNAMKKIILREHTHSEKFKITLPE
jgi:arylsulfatase A-like enzyme